MICIDELKFGPDGLIPAVVQDAASGRVLTVAYMNRESLEISLEKKLTCFFSRSRQELWLKGETSGNYQHIVSITADCDRDALLVRVKPDGPACHLGSFSCFSNPLFYNPELPDFSPYDLYELIKGRKEKPAEGSYTSYLFEKGLDKILKKVGEESTEVIIAGKAEDKRETVYEIADLYYHVLVLMIEAGISVDDVQAELASRHVVDRKVKAGGEGFALRDSFASDWPEPDADTEPEEEQKKPKNNPPIQTSKIKHQKQNLNQKPPTQIPRRTNNERHYLHLHLCFVWYWCLEWYLEWCLEWNLKWYLKWY